MIDIICFFLITALVFYVTFGGADFGAGMLEVFSSPSRKRQVQTAVNQALGPVWEANHIWLILLVVILFNALPQAYYILSTAFHIPIFLMLLGIICRGCAFIFRNYDSHDESSNSLYSKVFSAASTLTPFFQGMIIGGMIIGEIKQDNVTFTEAFIYPWFGLFQICVGFFFCALCMFNASCFLLAENKDAELIPFLCKRARICAFISIGLGALVFLSAHSSKLPLAPLYFSDMTSLMCFTLGGSLFTLIISSVRKLSSSLLRSLVGGANCLIILGWYTAQYPYLIGLPFVSTYSLNVYEIAAPDPVLRGLLLALSAGIILILPPLFYLFRVFKSIDEKI